MFLLCGISLLFGVALVKEQIYGREVEMLVTQFGFSLALLENIQLVNIEMNDKIWGFYEFHLKRDAKVTAK